MSPLNVNKNVKNSVRMQKMKICVLRESLPQIFGMVFWLKLNNW